MQQIRGIRLEHKRITYLTLKDSVSYCVIVYHINYANNSRFSRICVCAFLTWTQNMTSTKHDLNTKYLWLEHKRMTCLTLKDSVSYCVIVYYINYANNSRFSCMCVCVCVFFALFWVFVCFLSLSGCCFFCICQLEVVLPMISTSFWEASKNCD